MKALDKTRQQLQKRGQERNVGRTRQASNASKQHDNLDYVSSVYSISEVVDEGALILCFLAALVESMKYIKTSFSM